MAFEVLLRKYLMCRVTLRGWKAVAEFRQSSCAQSGPVLWRGREPDFCFAWPEV